jgi:FkbM family methyltransferase
MDALIDEGFGLRRYIAQGMLDYSQKLASRSSLVAKSVIWRISTSAVKMLGASQSFVKCDVYGRTFDVPGDLELASVLSRCPGYGRNLERLSATIARKYPDAPMIDVGANVGDTAVLMRRGATGPILCIEGSPRYAALCRRNLESIPRVTVVNAFVDTGRAINARIDENKGSGSAVFDETCETPTYSLAQAAAQFGFAGAKLVKIDTDGFDGRIIQAALPWLSSAQPVLFWELDLTSDEAHSGPGLDVLRSLAEIGYDQLMFYSNTGDYIVTADALDSDLLDDLTWYTSKRANRLRVPPAYADVCAFPRMDRDLAVELRARERRARSASAV